MMIRHDVGMKPAASLPPVDVGLTAEVRRRAWSVGVSLLLKSAPLIGAGAGLVVTVVRGLVSTGFDWFVVGVASILIGAVATTVGAGITIGLKYLFRDSSRVILVDVLSSLTGLTLLWVAVYVVIFMTTPGWNPLLVIALPTIVGTALFFAILIRQRAALAQRLSEVLSARGA